MTATYAIRKFIETGPIKERLQIKTFKTSEDMHKFLNTSDNACHWSEVKESNGQGLGCYPVKPGIYVFAGGQWRNVKSIDPSALAHM